MSIAIEALVRHGATFLLAGSALVGVGKLAHDYFSSTTARGSDPNDPNQRKSFDLVDAGVLVAKAVRATALPATCILCAWKLAKDPESVTTLVPALFSNYTNAAVSKFVPIYSRNMTEAFELGQIYRDHQKAQSENNNDAVQECLRRATTLMKNTGTITSEQLNALPQVLKSFDKKQGPLQRFLGVMTIANIAQVGGVTVLAGTVVPFLTYLFGDKIVHFAQVFVRSVLLPLHEICEPLYEHLAYVATAIAAIESARYPRDDALSLAGTGTAFTSIVMLFMSWMYTSSKISDGSHKHFQLWISLTAWMMTGFIAPLAVLHQSKFLGYLAALSGVVSLGFSAFSSGMCLFLGFDSEEDLIRCTLGCALVSVAMAAARSNQVDSRYLTPFQGPVSTVSTSVFFLGMLIIAEMNKAHLQFLACAGGYIAAGEILALPGMSNAAKTWLTIWGFSRVCLMTNRVNGIVAWFSGGLMMYFGAKFLQRNPKYVSAAIFGTQ